MFPHQSLKWLVCSSVIHLIQHFISQWGLSIVFIGQFSSFKLLRFQHGLEYGVVKFGLNAQA